ncbi:MAG: acyltransferase family protein [Alphaproteobacteria bacterium]
MNTPLSHNAQKAVPVYFGALDGFRGVLALCVAIYHTFWFSHINSTAFFNNGPVIIDLFFVFSGFLIYRLYHDRLDTSEQGATFLKRRFARLYPIHIFMLAVFIAFALVRIVANDMGLTTQDPGEILPFQAGSEESIYNILTHLTLTQAMGVSGSLTFNPPSWTISVEFFAYFVFVLLYLRFPPKTTKHFMLVGFMIAVVYFGLSRLKPDMNITYDLGFFRCLAGFFTGVVASWVYGLIQSQNLQRLKNIGARKWLALEVLALGSFLLFVIYMPGKLQFFVGPFAFVFVLVFAFDGGLISRFMSLPVFRYLAKISYSVYMVHAIFAITLNIIGKKLLPSIYIEGQWSGDLFLVPYLLLVIGFSHITWTYIERPGQKLLESLHFRKWFTSKIKARI